jgi:signal transduction histidine kinase
MVGPGTSAARRWRRHRGPGVGLAVLLSIIEVLGAQAAGREQDYPRDLTNLGAVLLMLGPAALVLRRRFPVAVQVVAFGTAIAYVLAGYPPGPFFLAPTAALFTAVRSGRRTPAAVVAAVGYLAYVGGGWWFADQVGVPAGARVDLRGALVAAVWLLAVIAVGEAARVNAERWAEVAKAREEQARARAEQQRRQASEERLRIARELHDVLGHHLSLINVQAGVGLHLLDNRPEQAREALTAIKSASAEALREVRSVLGVLRPDEEAAPRAPAPGLDRLPDLTADPGFPVTVRRTGEPRPLPPEVDRAAYRIVQEALTNVRRHAGPRAAAEVTVGYEDTGVRVTVRDDGRGVDGSGLDGAGLDGAGLDGAGRDGARPDVARPDGAGPDRAGPDRAGPDRAGPDGPGGDAASEGTGIAGMRARASALGGTLDAGPGDGGGFRVEAVLPVKVEQR